jgi:TPR repeat protein
VTRSGYIGLAFATRGGMGSPRMTTGHLDYFHFLVLKDMHPALHYLGISFNCGLATPKDVEKAFDYFLKAAEQGLPDAQEAVTGFLMEGTAGVKDPARGIRILNSR